MIIQYKSFKLVMLTVFFSLYSSANDACLETYQPTSTSGLVAYSSKSAVKNAQFVLKATESDVSEVVQKFESVVAKDTTILQKEQKERAEQMQREIEQLENVLTKEQIKSLMSEFARTGFLMSRLHEDIVRGATNIGTKKDFNRVKSVYLSQRQADLVQQNADVKLIMQKIREIFNRKPTFSESNFQKQMEIAENIKNQFYPNTGMTDKKMAIILDKMETFLKTHGGERILEISIKHSLYDMILVAHGRDFGVPAKNLNFIAGTAAYFAPFMVPLGVGIYSTITSTWEGSFIYGFGGLGAGVFLAQTGLPRGLQKLFDGNSTIINKALSVPKEAAVKWRRWTQRFKNKSKVAQSLEAEQKLLAETVGTNSSLAELNPLDQIRTELAGRISEPVQITEWSKGIDRLLESSIDGMAGLAQKQMVLEAEIVLITENLSRIQLGDSQRTTLNQQNRIAKQKMTDLILEWSELSNGLLTIAHVLDLYKERGEWERLNSPIPSAYRKFLEGKIQLLQVSENNLIEISMQVSNSLERAYSVLLTEDAKLAVGKIDRSLELRKTLVRK